MTLDLESDIPLLDPTYPVPFPTYFLVTSMPMLCTEGESDTLFSTQNKSTQRHLVHKIKQATAVDSTARCLLASQPWL